MQKKLVCYVLFLLLLLTSCEKMESINDEIVSVPNPEIDLTNEFISDSLGISFRYDLNWVIDENIIKPDLQIVCDMYAKIQVNILDKNSKFEYFTKDALIEFLERRYTDPITGALSLDLSNFKSGISNKRKYERVSVFLADKYMTWYFLELESGSILFVWCEETDDEFLYLECFDEFINGIKYIENVALEDEMLEFEIILNSYSY